jgi:hypothetical protein
MTNIFGRFASARIAFPRHRLSGVLLAALFAVLLLALTACGPKKTGYELCDEWDRVVSSVVEDLLAERDVNEEAWAELEAYLERLSVYPKTTLVGSTVFAVLEIRDLPTARQRREAAAGLHVGIAPVYRQLLDLCIGISLTQTATPR